jgi:hypothetical protein
MTAPVAVLDAPDQDFESGDPSDRPPRRQWWDRADGWIGLLVVLACVVFTLIQLSPKYLFRNTTANGGDTGAHIWWPAYLRDHLLPWRIAGWTPDWYAGFPAGQFYFPVPALLIVLMNVVLPYNIAFKIGTALGSLLLPAAAYVFGRGLRAPRPAPAAMAVAVTAFMFWTGDPGLSAAGKSIAFNQHIMGGTIASTMAGEFSFSLALAFALFFLGTFADALHTRRRLWLPALLLALTVTSHLMVGVFAVVAGLIVWLFHHPWRNFGRTVAIGVVGALLTAVWALPLLATYAYTTDMRYSPIGECASGTKCNLDGQHYVDYLFPSNLFDPHGWQPYRWGAYILIGILIVVAVAMARRAALVLLTIALASGLMFRFWTSLGSKVWNLRALPFWYLSIFLLMGMAVAELVIGCSWLARELVARRYRPPPRRPSDAPPPTVSAYAGSEPATLPLSDDPLSDDPLFVDLPFGEDEHPELPEPTPDAPAPDEPTPDAPTPGPAGPDGMPAPVAGTRSQLPGIVRAATSAVLTILLVVGALVQINHDKGFLPYWIKWDYSGYQSVTNEVRADGSVKYALAKAYPEYNALIAAMDKLPPGRALWEGGAALDKYGTPLALMLLPYWTHGRIQSMEGVYFEASATTPYHFETVAALVQAANASNPERGIPYRTNTDFTLGVRYLQTLGVNYFLTSEDGTKSLADADPRLTLVASTPDLDGIAPKGWNVYRVANSHRVQPLRYQPVVATGVSPSDWEQDVGIGWFWFPGQLDKPVVADGPASWKRAPGSDALRLPRRRVPAVHVSHVHSTDNSISFDVDRTGVPVVVNESYFPNWRADGADGPWRATPNFMVVVPTSHHVTLHYATTTTEWLGRFLTLVGIAGLVLLALWPRRGRGWMERFRVWWARRGQRPAGPTASVPGPVPASETGSETGGRGGEEPVGEPVGRSAPTAGERAPPESTGDPDPAHG